MQEATLKENEYHPSADNALAWIKEYSRDFERYVRIKEALASTALSGNRLAEICLSTIERLETGKPVNR